MNGEAETEAADLHDEKLESVETDCRINGTLKYVRD